MNKKKRLVVYEKALEIYKVDIKRGRYFGLCCTINDVQDKIFGFQRINAYYYMYSFPEIHKHKPKRFTVWRFSINTKYGINKRIWILE